MTDKRRNDPSLTEAELARVRAAYSDLEINRDPSGIIVMCRKPARGDDYADRLQLRRETVSRQIDLEGDRPRIETKMHRDAQDSEILQALEGLRDRLAMERETSDGVQVIALNVAIRALVNAIDILDSVIAHEQGVPRKVTGRNMEREILTSVDQSVEKTLEMLAGDPAKRGPGESIAAGQTIGAVNANARTQPLDLSERDIEVLLELINNPLVPNKKLKEAMRHYKSMTADFHTTETKSVSEIVDTE